MAAKTHASDMQRLDDASQRAQSLDRSRQGHTGETPRPVRPQSPKSRNCSRSRPSEDTDFRQDHQLIHIAASPSILLSDTRYVHRPASRVSFHQRSDSSNNLNGILREMNAEREASLASNDSMSRPASRAISRGRRPGSEPTHSTGTETVGVLPNRATSKDSVRNELLHRRVSSTQSHSRHSRARRTSTSQNGRPLSREATTGDFERVEAILCPNCPVHGRRSSSAGDHNDDAVPRALALNRHSPSNKSDSAIGHARKSDPVVDTASSQSTLSLNGIGAIPSQLPSSNEGAETSDSGSFADTLPTISTPGRSPATPSFFNPSTPKAMVFKSDDSDIDMFPSGHLNGVNRCIETDTVQVA